ncbi:CPBP family intramembrane glutamic endopeptidase [Lacticaseibacillus rhamnosus]|uniref:CPBP family intramembrane glutamic endopeptidase n=1 Tax=Lacticaseibacillus rhamnosus TaxID=47715 RepID=UPI000532E326|nr:CPBP family intramembrane glutamic endopeptidase [Lacticaseibacillus rhamnosus]
MKHQESSLIRRSFYMLVLYLLSPLPLLFLLIMPYTNNVVSSLSLAFACVTSSVVVIYIAYKLFHKYTNQKIIQRVKLRDIFYVIGGYLTILISNEILSTLNYTIYQRVQTSNNQVIESSLLSHNQLMVILLAINVIVLGPITEELVFRGILMHLFFKQNQLFFKVLLSALIFASAHGGDTIFGFLMYTIMGTVFAVVYLKTGKIQNAIALHFVNNIVAVSTILFL